MKTTDKGGSFKGVFDSEAVASTGAVAVAPSNAKVVWLGTGEANDRNSSGWGNGVYRSTDAGATWTQAGLPPARRSRASPSIRPIPDTAWVAAMGDLWTPSRERGLYKTTDGGKTWKAVLTAPAPYGDRVGAGDLVLDPADPQVLYAALYARRRTPWSFIAGPAGHGRQGPGRHLQEHGRRHHLAQALRRAARPAPAASASPSRARTPRSSTRSCRATRRGRAASTRCAAGAAASSAPRTAARPGRARARSTRAPSTSARSASIPRTTSGCTSWASPSTSPTTAAGPSARTSSRRSIPTTTPSPSIRATPSVCCSAPTAASTRATRRAKAGSTSAGWPPASSIASTSTSARPTASAAACRTTRTGWARAARTRRTASSTPTGSPIGGGDGFYCAFDADAIPSIVYAESQQGYVQRMDLRSG